MTNKSKWHELIQVSLSFYPVGLKIPWGTLDDDISLSGLWEDCVSDDDLDKAISPDDEVTLLKEFVTCSMTFLHEGLGESFIREEYHGTGSDCFNEADLKRIATEGRVLRDEWAAVSKSGGMDYHIEDMSSHINLMTLWTVNYSYSGPNYWGEDDGDDVEIDLVRLVRLSDVIDLVTAKGIESSPNS